MNIAVLNTQIPYSAGGAEQLAGDLVDALSERGHRVTLITVPFKWYPQQAMLDSIVACKLLDVSEFNNVRIDKAIALRFPVWLMQHDDMALWLLHQHRSAYDLWDTDYSDLAGMRDSERVRDLIRREDNAAIGSCERVYAISRNVADRLQQYNGLDAGVLYPPPRNMDKFHFEQFGDFFFFPSRINPLKRQALVIEALAHTREAVKVCFAGMPDSDDYFETLRQRAEELGVTSRIEWLGHVSEQEKIALYANCKMVIFPPVNEDYGYITPEAMLSSKGVITLEDSGGSLEFVVHNESGAVLPADARALGAEMDRIWSDERIVRAYGEGARARVAEINLDWDSVIGHLL